MTARDRFERVMEIIDVVRTAERHEREALISKLCHDDAELRSEVESLLQHEKDDCEVIAAIEKGEGPVLFAEKIIGQVDDTPRKIREQIPMYIGRFRIVREIGRGGMGVVYEAEQESPKRRVALKVIRAGHISDGLIRRLEREAFVLGQLQHAGIAHIYESGMVDVDGYLEPFFAMELIAGERISVHVRANGLTIRQRLELMARVCDAVHHAHQKGIIHRDLKPANILVLAHSTEASLSSKSSGSATNVDLIGQPKILDFGVARITNSDLQATTMQTDIGQLIGTLAYMSPEQIQGDSSKVDTRCDVYALGVVLFEVLTNRLPLDLDGKSVAEAARIICDDEPNSASSVDRALRGDVETIIGKALEKDPEYRYASAAELAADLRRVLGDEPIVARPASMMYQVRKFARRNRGLVGGLFATFAALVIGLIGTGYFLVEATRQRDEAIAARKQADDERDNTNDVARFQARLLRNLSANDFGKTLMMELRNELQRAWDDAESDDAAIAEEAVVVDRAFNRANGSNVARAVLSRTFADRALQLIEKRLDDDPLTDARLRRSVAQMYKRLGYLDAAAEQYRASLDTRSELLAPDHYLTIQSMRGLAQTYRRMGHLAEAEKLYREIFARQLSKYGLDHRYVLVTMGSLAAVRMELGDLNEAEQLLAAALEGSKRTLGVRDSSTMNRQNTYCALLLRMEKTDEALACFAQLLETREKVSGKDHTRTITVRNNLMSALFKAHRFDEAEPIAHSVLDSSRRKHGDTHASTILAMNNLGVLLLNIGRPSDANSILREAHSASQSELNPEHKTRMKSTSNLIDSLLALKQPVEAESLCDGLLAVRRGLKPSQPGLVAQTLEQLGHTHYQQGRFESARDAWQECVDLRTGISMKHWLTNRARSQLGEALTALHDYAVAEKLLTESYTALVAQKATIPPVAGAGCVEDARARLVKLYELWGRPAEMAKWQSLPDETALAEPSG